MHSMSKVKVSMYNLPRSSPTTTSKNPRFTLHHPVLNHYLPSATEETEKRECTSCCLHCIHRLLLHTCIAICKKLLPHYDHVQCPPQSCPSKVGGGADPSPAWGPCSVLSESLPVSASLTLLLFCLSHFFWIL